MAPEPVRSDYWPINLEIAVTAVSFAWPGWRCYLAEEFGDDGSGGLKLFFISSTPNSYNPDETIRVKHEFLVPRASYTTSTWLAWIFDRYCDVWAHEAGETFLVAGVRVFGPHHGNGEDPYRRWFVGDLADTRVKAGETR